jgi:hypothetical protein
MIYHVAHNACIRVFKEAIALRSAGAQVVPVARRYGYGDMMAELGPVVIWQSEEDLARVLQECTSGDIIHLHAEPGPMAGLAAFVHAYLPHVPLVLDVHDSEWGRGRKAHPKELADLEAADMVVVPSVAYASALPKVWHKGRPAVRIPSACIFGGMLDALETLEEKDRMPHLGGVCYEGGLGLKDWRDYRGLLSALTDCGVNVFVYAPNAHEMVVPYCQSGAVIQMRPYRDLLSSLTRHDWALVCPPGDGNQEWATAMPNKFFEAMLCALPVVSFGCPEVAGHVEKYGLGVVVKDRAALLEWAATTKAEPPHQLMRLRCVSWARAHGLMDSYVSDLLACYAMAREAHVSGVTRVNGGAK